MGGRAAALVGLALALGAAGCGYGFSTRYVARGGAEAIRVAPFENRSTEPELGAAVTTALRTALARRGAEAGADADGVLEGEVTASEPVPSSPGGATWRIAVEVRARLRVSGSPPEERTVRREVHFLGGTTTATSAGGAPVETAGDPLESEARRAMALRRAADEVAADVLRAFER